VNLGMKEIGTLKELGLEPAELWKKFNPTVNILRRPRDNVVQKIFDLEQLMIIYVNFEAVLKFESKKENTKS
jgi:hypothetical protein